MDSLVELGPYDSQVSPLAGYPIGPVAPVLAELTVVREYFQAAWTASWYQAALDWTGKIRRNK